MRGKQSGTGYARVLACRSLDALWPFLLGLLLLGLLWSPLARPAGAGEAGVDAVLVIDSSGSMKETDPRRLRVAAAKMFISLLGPEDRVGLISFSDDGYPVIHLTPATPANQSLLFKGVDKVSARGVYTNLHAALAKGRKMLLEEGDPKRRRLLVLMSDGKMDVGDWNRDRELMRGIREDLIPQLRNDGIEAYTIAFTEASDMRLMREIADGTGAMSRMASNDRALHQVFSTLFESAKEPDMLPIKGGEFLVDDSVEEVTIVASKGSPLTEIYLVMPDGRRITAEVAGRRVRWFKSEAFDMITLLGPPAGRWRLVSDTDGARAYVVTNLGLEARLAEGADPAPGRPVDVLAWLQQSGSPLARPELLAATRFTLTVDAGEGAQPQVIDMVAAPEAGEGVQTGWVVLDKPGSYRLRVGARSKTFQREKSLFIEIPAPEADAPETPAPVEQPPAEPEPEAKPEVAPAAPLAEDVAAKEETPAEQAKTEPEPDSKPEKKKKKGLNIGLVISLFVLVNLLIGGLVAGFIIWRRKRKAAAGDGEPEEGADDEGDADEDKGG